MAMYSFSDGVLHVERRLETKTREVVPAQMDAYRKFTKGILEDENTFIRLSGQILWDGAVSGSREARDLYEQGRQAWELHNLPAATEAFRRAVDKDPKFAQAWIALGTLRAGAGAPDEAIEDLKKAVVLEPTQVLPYQALSSLLIAQHRPEDALTSWKELEKTVPQNSEAPKHIAGILMSLKRYSEAIPEFEAALRLDPGDAGLLVPLSTAYARSGDREKAVTMLEKSAERDSSANNLNSVAYAMADDNLQLDDALKYAEQAVRIEESETAEIDLDELNGSSLRTPSALAAYWDTLGWVHFRMGHLDQAEKYVNAAWHVAQDPIVGDHLGQVFEKEGKKQQAITAYSNTLATRRAPEGTTVRLEALRPGASSEWGKAINPIQLQDMRMVKVKVSPKPTHHASAEFFMLLAPGPKVAAVKFLNEQDAVPGAKDALKSAKFDVPFPDEEPVQILRRGILDCEPEIPECTIALIPPGDVRSVN
jgi:tetratricopeptide (TPR) repeat protein